MKRRHREKLPPIPSGTEILDMEWREMTPYAEIIFEALPVGIADRWASAVGVHQFWVSTRACDRARCELERTATHSALWHMRDREAKRLATRSDEFAANLLGALHRDFVKDWPMARPEQVLLLIQRRLEALTDEVASAIRAGVVLPELVGEAAT